MSQNFFIFPMIKKMKTIFVFYTERFHAENDFRLEA